MRKVSSVVNRIFLSVMQHHLFWVVFVAYFSFFNKCETKQQQENEIPPILSQLFKNRKPPIILYLEPRQNYKFAKQRPRSLRLQEASFEEDEEDLKRNFKSMEESPELFRDGDETEEDFLKTTQSNERAYLLYHLLRTTIEEEDIDPAIVQRLQPAKELLRNAFIGRCRNLNRCMRQCPKPKTKYSCTVQCKQIFDDLDECDEPQENKCMKSKCGNTMPPTWLL